MSQDHVTAEPQGPLPQPRGLWVSLIALLIAMLLATLDNLILSAAMPTIVRQLGGLADLSWVVTAYSLATATSTPIWGKLSDMYGRKGVFIAAIVVFLIGSALAGSSQSMGQLIAFRAVQGLGGGGLMVGSYAIMADLVPSRERGKAQGLFSSVMGLAMVSGPLAGGLITDHLGWRWGFWLNLPLSVLALVVVIIGIRLPKRRSPARADYPGAVLLTVAIATIVLVTSWGGHRYTWDSPMILGLIALALVAGVAFLQVERTAVEPVLPLQIFRNGNFSLGTVIGFLAGIGMFVGMTFLPLFQQAAQGTSATSSGLLLLPVFGAMMGINLVVGQVITKTGRYKLFIVAGSVLLPLGLLLMAQMDPGTPKLLSVPYMAVFGAGMGCLMQTAMLIAMESVQLKDMGVASSTVTLSRTVGGSIGVAVMGSLFAQRLQDSLSEQGGAAAGIPAGSAQLDVAGLPAAARAVYANAVTSGMNLVFLISAAITATGIVAACFIREIPLRSSPVPGAKAAEPAVPAPEKA
ncbi:MDR family MFS transporter [Kitasatospora sp. NPDC096128]|uniref:MDR family MFS transporter n=1 Tax=Kitasatospora sp. NPDC096128 TaxID=3155547 RepID=UPI00331C1589